MPIPSPDEIKAKCTGPGGWKRRQMNLEILATSGDFRLVGDLKMHICYVEHTNLSPITKLDEPECYGIIELYEACPKGHA